MKPQLIATGVLEMLITLLQLAPFVVLVELARQLLAGADESALRSTLIVFVVLLGAGTVLSAGLLLWLHVVDMRFSATIRRRLLDKLARVPLGWFTQRGSGAVKKLIQDDTLSLHYLVTHAVSDAVAAVVAPDRGAGVSLRRRLAVGVDPAAADPGLHRHDVDDGVPERPEDHRGIPVGRADER